MKKASAAAGRRRTLMQAAVWLVVIITLLLLGVWQLQRLHWKNDLLHQQARMMQAEPVTLAALEEPVFMQPLTVRGRLLWDKALWFGPKARRSGVAFHLVVPLLLSDTPDNGAFAGRHLLVLLGEAPKVVRERWQPPADASLVTLTGGVRPSVLPDWRSPTNRPQENFWQLLYVEEIASALHLKPFMPFALQAFAPPEGLGGLTLDALPRQPSLSNNHKQYAITWFLLALVAAGYAAASLRARHR